MENTRIVKKIAWAELGGKKRRGKLRRRGGEEVMQNIRDKQIINSKERAKDRKRW